MTPSRLALALAVAGFAALACLCHLAGCSARQLVASAFVGMVALASIAALATVLSAAAPRRVYAPARATRRR